MTIRKYLFLLISSLLLMVALVQVSLILYFKSNIEEEVERRGQLVADKIINIAIENIEQDEILFVEQTVSEISGKETLNKKSGKRGGNALIEIFENNVHIKNNAHTDNKPIFVLDIPKSSLKKPEQLVTLLTELPNDLQQEVITLASEFSELKNKQLKNNIDGFIIEISNNPQMHIQRLKKRLRHQIAEIHENRSKEAKFKVFSRDEADLEFSTIVDNEILQLPPKFRKDKHIINKFSYLMIAAIVLTTLLAFILVFVFSKRFSTPLNTLSEGFKKLEQGEFGLQVSPSGVEEVKNTILGFNYMSHRLLALAEAEKQIHQQQHLTEISDISKGIAHALRNPLHTIGLAIEQLESEQLSADLKRKLTQRVRNKIQQLDKSIKVLLTITSGEIDRQQNVHLSSVINDVLLELRQSHDNSLGDLTIDMSLDDNISFFGATAEVRTVIHTLIYNGYEASLSALTSNDKQNISLKITSVQQQHFATVSISDSGNGIAPEIESSLFQPHISNKAEGAGMGLYISKRIVEIYYHGDLSLSNIIDQNQICGATACCSFRLNSKEEI